MVLIGRDALDRYRGLAGDELEVVEARDVNDRAVDALDAGIPLAIFRVYPATMMITGRPTAAGGPPAPDATNPASTSVEHAERIGVPPGQSSTRTRVSRLN
jgi:hypothetical protein